MIDTDNWDYYYNFQNEQTIRANLVYTPLVSPDKKKFCMWFVRDENYHYDFETNLMWSDDLLEDRFRKELKYHKLASKYVPTLEILEVDQQSRKIIIEWHENDFYMDCLENSPESVLSSWDYQMTNIMKKLWKNNIVKLSLHPNSWIVKNDHLVPFNWFFCYDKDTGNDSLKNLIIQISETRLEKVYEIFRHLGYDPSRQYSAIDLQKLALHSFKSNYDEKLINNLINQLNEKSN